MSQTLPVDDRAAKLSQPRPEPSWVVQLLRPLASLQLTVVLFALCMVLVLAGTVAQVDSGIWTVVKKYFRSFFVWIPFQVFLPRKEGWLVPGGFPFPGGWTLGTLLLANLLAAHLVRFKLSWKRSGILLIHAGMIIMLLGELVTGVAAVEARMTIEKNQSANFTEDNLHTELVLIDSSDPKFEDVVAVPSSLLQKGGRISHEALPVDVEVVKFMANSTIPDEMPKDFDNPATAGAGTRAAALERPEVSGVDPEQQIDAPSAYVRFHEKGTDKVIDTYLVSLWLKPQKATLAGKTYELSLRFKREYKPYTVHLLDFKHERYIGTDTPKDFRSTIRLIDPETGEDRQLDIYMNAPLRYRGETFYQSGVLPADKGTILQVVRNPGVWLPYISCAVVTLGMLIHFLLQLTGFLSKRAAV